MPDTPEKVVISQVLIEERQEHPTRRYLYESIERLLKRPVASFFTSFSAPVMIESSDADMLEGVLQRTDLAKGLALLISSPGGDILAAERIINVCRSYSGTGEYWAIVPSKAKSAATVICFGASKLIMASTSELGSIDPQVAMEGKRFSVHNIVTSYRELFSKAVEEKGNLQPYLQQLANYDAREIAEFQSALELSEDIAVKSLKSGVMTDVSEKEIKKRIKDFLTPRTVKTHGRPIYHDLAKACGLEVDLQDPKGKLWQDVYELYVRLDHWVSTRVDKCIETKDHSFVATLKRGEE